MKSTILSVVLFIVSGVSSTVCHAQPARHGMTSWDTYYLSIGGQRIDGTTVMLNGDSGSYSNRSVSGRLFNMRYEFLSNGDWLAAGEWQSGNVGGTFQFQSQNGNPRYFDGFYSVDGRSGRYYWNGQQAGGFGSGQNCIPPVTGEVTYGPWTRDADTGLCLRKCYLPGGDYQYLVYWSQKPDWVFWYNPKAKVYWCACPTTSHPRFGHRIANGELIFLRCEVNSQRLSQCELQGEHAITGSMTVTNQEGNSVAIDNVPDDKPLL